MMHRVAKFEKVSFEQFLKDYCKTFHLDSRVAETIVNVREIWDKIELPKRATKGSAGYDFKSTVDITLHPNGTIAIPTGVRCKINEDWVLSLYPRSGLGFKYRLQLNNSVGVIDSDYYYSDNEGHIFVKLTNDSNEDKTLEIKNGDGVVQGIFTQFGITDDDNVEEKRNGGFGSTGK